MQYIFNKILDKFLIFICLLSVFGGIIYYFNKLNWPGIIISLVLTLAGFFIFIYLDPKNKNKNKINTVIIKKAAINRSITLKIFFNNYFLPSVYLLLFMTGNLFLLMSRTDNSIISPWQAVSFYFFIVYILATIILVLSIIKNKKINLFLITLHYFLSFSVVLTVYKIGYGYDSFIHQAAAGLIDKTGQVLPKTFYYLGQYSFEVIIHKLTFIPLVWLDRFLVPILASLFLPAVLFKALSKWFADDTQKKLTILFLLILPFTAFIVTTPQNLAYLFLLLLILYGLTCKDMGDILLIYLLAAAAFITQPIAGIPALLFALVINIYYSDWHKLKKYLYGPIYAMTAISLPIAFYILEKGQKIISPAIITGNNEAVKNTASGIKNILAWFYFNNPRQENVILNLTYLYLFNLKTIFFILFITGLIIIIKNRKECGITCLYIFMSLSLFVSYLLADLLPFQFLIFYERDNYINRILLISVLFLIPVFMIVIYALTDKILKQNNFIKYSFLSFFALLITVSLYGSYPRYDRYFNSHGYSTGKNDIEAVRWINDNTENDYIVLANQQVSAAALREFGFNKYYKIIPTNEGDNRGEIFYYPVPTSGPLYNYYLDMVYKKPARTTMEKAMDLAGVDESYFILNKYWWAFPKILDEAKLEADSWKVIGNQEIYIFKYNK